MAAVRLSWDLYISSQDSNSVILMLQKTVVALKSELSAQSNGKEDSPRA